MSGIAGVAQFAATLGKIAAGTAAAAGLAALFFGVPAAIAARKPVYATTGEIEEQVTARRKEELEGIRAAKLLETRYARELAQEKTREEKEDIKERLAEADAAMARFVLAQAPPGAIRIQAAFLANEFVNVLRLRYPLAFSSTPGLARTVEARLVSAMARNTLPAVEQLEKQLEYEVAVAASRAAAGEETYAPIGY